MITEEQAIILASAPEKIIDALQCNEVIGFLNGKITDLAMSEWEAELAANQHQVSLLHKEITNALAQAEWKISEQYKNWRKIKLELQKFRAYRLALRKKEESLQNSSKFVRNNYSNYPRAM